MNGARSHPAQSEPDVGKSEPPTIDGHLIPQAIADAFKETKEPLEKKAVRLTVELAGVLADMRNSDDESLYLLMEGIVEQLARVAGMGVDK